MSYNRCQHCGLRNWEFARVCEGCGHVLPATGIHHKFHPVIDSELRKICQWNPIKHPKCLTALWFACAANVPGVLLLWFFRDGELTPAIALAVTLLPSGLACLFGAWLGSPILNSTQQVTGSGAFWRGALVAFLSYVCIGTLYALAFLYVTPRGAMDLTGIIVILGFVLLAGFILVGWWATLIGGLAGWVLHLKYRSRVC